MKKFLPMILIAVSMLMCCSCSSSVSLKNPSENSADQVTNNKKSVAAKAWEECDKSEMQTFTGEDGGIALTVMTDKREYTIGEPIRVKAEAQNITNGGLWYVCGNSIENYPIEMHINILDDGRYFKSDRSEIRNSEMVYFSMTPGELYDDYVTFETGYFNGEPAKPGVYNGTCYIYTVPDKDYDGESTEHSLDFSITLTDYENSKIEKILYDLEHRKSAEDLWEECDKSEMQTFTGESRGIAFTVSTDKREYAVNETVRVKAEVQNVSGGELYNVYLSLGECYPIEILLDIDCGSPSLYNKKNTGTTQRRSYLVPMKPGEVYEDYISFEANCVYHPTVPGEYKGRCYVYTVPDPDHNNAWAMHSIDFSITLTGYENSEIEKILYDLEHRKSAEDLWEECDKSEMQTFTGEDGGIAFTVLTDKREYTIGETIKVKAKMQNNTDSDIYLPSGGQILPKLDNPHDGETLYTGWLEGYCVLDCENSFQLSPGEVYEHCSVFETHYYKGGTAEPGEYNGICNFYTVPYSILNGEQINHSLDFSITLKQSDPAP